MNLYILIILSFIIKIICIENFPFDNETITLTDSSIEKAINQFENLMIYFYAPWCGHCKIFEPEYQKASKILKKENIYLAKIDSSNNNLSAQKYKINGFPTILFFKKGVPFEFEGARSSKELINWGRKRAGIPIQLLNSKEEIENFKSNNDICLIYFGDIEDEIKKFSDVSMMIEEHPFAIVTNISLIKKYSNNGTIVLFKHFDEKKVELRNFNKKKIIDFIQENALPKVMLFNDKSVQYIFQKKHPALILFEKTDSKNWNYYGNIMTQVSEKLRGKIILVMTDIKEGISSRLADYVGIKEKDLPIISILDTRKDFKKYNMKGEINHDNIINFFYDWEQNKLKRTLKSEKEPKYNDNIIRIVVGATFEKEVINNDKDIMIIFYAPWCNHCKEFMPKYEQAAKILKDNDKLIMAKIDGSANEVENIPITGFPTIFFFPGNKKHEKPIQYNGKRTTEDIIQFIKKYSTNEIKEKIEKNKEKENESKNEKNNDEDKNHISDL